MEAAARALLNALREQTQLKHQQLDGLLSARAFDSKQNYIEFLLGSWRAATPIEAAVAARLGADFMPERAPRLQADLRALHVDVTPETLPTVQLETDAAAWGAAYVLEGSALGGAVLAESVQAALGSEVARSYLTLRGVGTASRWRWFLGALAAFAQRSSASEQERATLAASSAFDAYLAAFTSAFPEV